MANDATTSFYRSVWRWHFYAGLISLPFLISLSITGALYLFQDQLNDLAHGGLRKVVAQNSAPAAPTSIVSQALAAYPGKAYKYGPAPAPDRSAEVGVTTEAGERISVFVNPYSREVLGSLSDKGTIMWVVRELHSLSLFGTFANGLIEVVGGWSILLVVTGIYLWWPRGARERWITLRGKSTTRVFWRDLHAGIGVFAGVFIVFLAMSGMPWSVFWGNYVNQWANSSNYGYPNGVRVNVPMSNERLAAIAGPTAWSLEQARLPESATGSVPAKSSATDGTPKSMSLDAAVQKFEKLGLAAGYSVSVPSDPKGVYTGSVYPKDLSQQRVVHLDQYSGLPLLDMSYKDYGWAGKTLEWGINVHMGQEFGVINQIVMLLVCLSIILLSVTSAVMWWKRRPTGQLGAPPLPKDPKTMRTVTGALAIGGVIFPLVGLSMIAIAILDRLFFAQAFEPKQSI